MVDEDALSWIAVAGTGFRSIETGGGPGVPVTELSVKTVTGHSGERGPNPEIVRDFNIVGLVDGTF